MRIGARLRAMMGGGAKEVFPPIAPDYPFYVIGDIHGRLDLLQALLARIDPQAPLVFVGDYVDRGEDSAGVLRALSAMTDKDGREVVCLLGNHEDMLLQFLDAPEEGAEKWVVNGGLQTMASFGLRGVSERLRGERECETARALQQAMGDDLVDWLRTRTLGYLSGNVAVVHAGADPAVGIEDQKRRTLLWGHGAFGKTPRKDGIWVVHGHTIVDAPVCDAGIVSVDTGAYATGVLTAAHIQPGKVDFVQAA